MGELIKLEARAAAAVDSKRRRWRSAVIHAFPGARQLGVVDKVAFHMASLGEVEAEEFLVLFFEVEERRLLDLGVADGAIDRYIFEAARAIWARMRNIRAGVA